jgi:hypothetical protein
MGKLQKCIKFRDFKTADTCKKSGIPGMTHDA